MTRLDENMDFIVFLLIPPFIFPDRDFLIRPTWDKFTLI